DQRPVVVRSPTPSSTQEVPSTSSKFSDKDHRWPQLLREKVHLATLSTGRYLLQNRSRTTCPLYGSSASLSSKVSRLRISPPRPYLEFSARAFQNMSTLTLHPEP